MRRKVSSYRSNIPSLGTFSLQEMQSSFVEKIGGHYKRNKNVYNIVDISL